MRLLIELDGHREIVELGDYEAQATLAELVDAAAVSRVRPGEQLFLDGTAVDLDAELSTLTLLEGSRLARTPVDPVQQIPGWNVSVTAGARAGTAVQLPQHRRLIVGRSPQVDLVLDTESASWVHCTMELEGDGVRVRDAGSTNGTRVDGVSIDADGVLVEAPTHVITGGAVLTLRPRLREAAAPAPGEMHRLTQAGTAPFNRPPKLGQTPRAEPIVPPVPQEIPEAMRFSFIAVLAPLVMAGVLIVVLGNIRFALFALLSPIMGIGMHFEQRRRRARSVKDEELRFAEALAAFEKEIAEAAKAEAHRLRESTPDLAIVLRRPAIPATQLWSRRSDHPDCLTLEIGIGDVPWHPELDVPGGTRLDARVREVLAEARMTDAPVVADLSGAGVIGIAGDREGALALARSLVTQAAVHVGPADLTVAVFCDDGREGDWGWASWLPHTRRGSGDGSRWLSHTRKESTALLRTLLDDVERLPAPLLLTVLDTEVLTHGRDAPARELLGHGRPMQDSASRREERPRQVSGIVIAGAVEELPAVCTTVVEVGSDAECAVQRDDGVDGIEGVVLSGVSRGDAEECARALARFEDPEIVIPGASLPTVVRLHEILGTDEMSPELVLRLWGGDRNLTVPIGFGESGLFSIDLVNDGPHGVVAGTTGSGKSEILKTLLASLVAHATPEQLSLILVDFKGGAAFAAFERLPHTIGTISNLDEQLADRAIRALQAEMRRRQRLFAAAGEGIENLTAYLATNPAEPLPRILFIVDEFKELVRDYPDVLASLVSIAAIGRTLGVHMILATQQPAGVVSEAILTNSNLRIAARVQNSEDSSSVICDGSAATISRFHRGRAYVQRGLDDLELVQTAFVSAPVHVECAQRVEVRRVGPYGSPRRGPESAREAGGATDLDALAEAVIAANAAAGYAPPRRVWPEPLGQRVPLAGYRTAPVQRAPGTLAPPEIGGVTDDEVVTVALADDPDAQRQLPAGWKLGDGNLIVMGVPGSGTSTALTSIALSLAHRFSPDELDILCLDSGGRSLAPLMDLPHTTAYVGTGGNAGEQQVRMLRHLREERQRRSEQESPARRMVVLIDGFAALVDDFRGHDDTALLDGLYRAYADGPALGMHFVLATTRAKSLPAPIDDVTTQRWVFRLADELDYSHVGIRGAAKPAAVPGRCVDIASMLHAHIATPDGGLDEAVREATTKWEGATEKADAIGTFPERVAARELAGLADLSGEPIRIPVGIREDTLAPGFLSVYESEHILIAGPSRSGKSTLLLGIAEVLLSLPEGERPAVWGVCDRRSPLGRARLDRLARVPDEIAPLLGDIARETGPVFLLVDDAERTIETSPAITALVSEGPPQLHIIAAARAEDVRGSYSHWIKRVGTAGCGVLLQADRSLDVELLGLRPLPAPPVAVSPGRGFLCGERTGVLIHSISPSEEETVLT